MFVWRHTLPDDPTIASHAPHAVQRYTVQNSFIIVQFEHELIVRREADCLKRYHQNAIFLPVMVANLKMARPEARVPADAFQKLVYGLHGVVCGN